MAVKLDPLDQKILGGESVDFPVRESNKCDHGGNFRYESATEVRCVKCNFGLYIDVQDRLKDGHLYRRDKLII